MTTKKKKEPFWIGPGSPPPPVPSELKPPDGTTIQKFDMSGEEILIHITWPSYWDVDNAKAVGEWAEKIKKSMARKKIQIICSIEDIKINVMRPRTVRVMMSNCYIEEPDFILRLKEEMKDVSNLEVVVTGCNIKKGKGGSKCQ